MHANQKHVVHEEIRHGCDGVVASTAFLFVSFWQRDTRVVHLFFSTFLSLLLLGVLLKNMQRWAISGPSTSSPGMGRKQGAVGAGPRPTCGVLPFLPQAPGQGEGRAPCLDAPGCRASASPARPQVSTGIGHYCGWHGRLRRVSAGGDQRCLKHYS